MKFIPMSVSRQLAKQALSARETSPKLLFGVGIFSMVGSTVMACRATLKLDEVLGEIEHNKGRAVEAKHLVDSGAVENQSYSDSEFKRDNAVILVRGAGNIVKIYAPAVILGGVGIICLTKSHRILQERNMALTAAYMAVDTAFRNYRERVVERYGEEVDRELRYEHEVIDIIDEETGKVVSKTQVVEGDHGVYARWFGPGNGNWNSPEHMEMNYVFLRSQQLVANDLLRHRGHMVLNDVYEMLGLEHTSAGAIVGWVYERDNPVGDNYIDFGCWANKDGTPQTYFENGRDGSILLDFNVDGPVWQLIDERNEKNQ